MSQPTVDPENREGGARPQVAVYTDGGCDPNPGPGGWGAVVRWKGREWVLSGNDPDTTNNRMELQAAASALALLDGLVGRCRVDIYTDSQYLRRGMTEWLAGWVERGWRTQGGQPVKNQDLWMTLHGLVPAHDVTWHWLKGHAGHSLNERADRLATEALRALRKPQPAPEVREPATKDLPAVDISVKSSCRGAKGPGGWGAVLRVGDHTKTISGRDPSTTANAMLVRGATEALKAMSRPCQVTLFSDAKYLIQGGSSWVKGWQAGGWQTREGKPVANQEEWKALVEAAGPHQVTWRIVQGDDAAGDLARAGELASEASSLEKGEV